MIGHNVERNCRLGAADRHNRAELLERTGEVAVTRRNMRAGYDKVVQEALSHVFCGCADAIGALADERILNLGPVLLNLLSNGAIGNRTEIRRWQTVRQDDGREREVDIDRRSQPQPALRATVRGFRISDQKVTWCS